MLAIIILFLSSLSSKNFWEGNFKPEVLAFSGICVLSIKNESTWHKLSLCMKVLTVFLCTRSDSSL